MEKELYMSRHTERPGHSAEILFLITKPTNDPINVYSKRFATNLAYFFMKMKNEGILKDTFDIHLDEMASYRSGIYGREFRIFIPSCEDTFHNILVSKVEEISKIVERFASEIILYLGYEQDAKIIIRENQYESKIVTFSDRKEN